MGPPLDAVKVRSQRWTVQQFRRLVDPGWSDGPARGLVCLHVLPDLNDRKVLGIAQGLVEITGTTAWSRTNFGNDRCQERLQGCSLASLRVELVDPGDRQGNGAGA